MKFYLAIYVLGVIGMSVFTIFTRTEKQIKADPGLIRFAVWILPLVLVLVVWALSTIIGAALQ